MSKPIACGFNTSSRNLANLPKPGGFPVKYKCPSCDTVFNEFVGLENIHYCYNCGESLYRGGTISHINSKQSDLLKELDEGDREIYRKGLLSIINEANESNDRPERVFIEEEDESRN